MTRRMEIKIPLERIVSGGQSGVDRAALEMAEACGIPYGGWCPRGRRAEDGPIDARHPLQETPSREYRQRTAWNVRDSDGTLILYRGVLSGGTALTRRIAEENGKPFFVADLAWMENVTAVRAWLQYEGIRVLNVAGPRESENPGIQQQAGAFLSALLRGEP